MKEYNKLTNWCDGHEAANIAESVLFAYFEKLSKTKKNFTLYATCSKLKTIVNVKRQIVLLKRYGNYQSKKSKMYFRF